MNKEIMSDVKGILDGFSSYVHVIPDRFYEKDIEKFTDEDCITARNILKGRRKILTEEMEKWKEPEFTQDQIISCLSGIAGLDMWSYIELEQVEDEMKRRGLEV